MANLIITIIGIALVGVAAAMAVFYGGTAFNDSQAQVYANMLISESQQLMAANTEYMVDQGLSSFEDFGPDAAAIGNYTTGRVPILGLDTVGYDFSYDIYPNLSSNTIANQDSSSSYNTNGPYVGGPGQYIHFNRSNDSVNGTNAIVYNITACPDKPCTVNSDIAPASMANSLLVQICKDINAQMPPPAGMTYSASGLPEMDTNTSSAQSSNKSYLGWYIDTTRTTLNYCYLGTTGYTTTMYFVFSN